MRKSWTRRGVVALLIFFFTLTTVFDSGITASAAGSKAVKKITVKIKKKNVTKKTHSLKKGKTAALKVSVKPKSAKKSIKYKSSKPKIVSVSKKGKVTAKKKGTAKIKITVTGKNKKKKSTWVKIKVTKASSTSSSASSTPSDNAEAVTKVEVTAAQTNINVGTSTKVTAVVSPSTAKTNISWSSSNESVALVSQDGTVTGMNAGSSVITAKADNGVSGSVTINVSAVAVTGVSLNRKSTTLTIGNPQTLTATVTPANATVKIVDWQSSNPAIATVNSNGLVTPVKEGDAEIKVTTRDGGFSDICKVTVTKDSSEDMNGIDMAVTNSISGYPNTVLAGTDAKINIEVTKDGVPVGNDSVHFELDNVSGYTSFYELEDNNIKLDDKGVGTVYIRLRDGITRTARYTSYEDAAYASFNLKATVGGANYEDEISVSFAQVLTQTKNSYSALSVENEYDYALKNIDPANSILATATTTNKDGIRSEYVVDQKVSSEKVADGDHEVVLDAAPLLILPTTQGKEDSSTYSQDNLNAEQKEYSVYSDEENAVTLKNVPGGLQYLTLNFKYLQLSEYTRIVVRAYEPGTNFPLHTADGDLVEKIIGPDTVVTETDSNNSVQIDQTIFNDTTAGMRNIDLKIFVQSAGQVNEDKNIGFKLVKAEGLYKNKQEQPFDWERLDECVSWSYRATKPYAADVSLSAADASKYLGSAYESNSTYKYTKPTFPDSGNAIITEYKNSQKGDCYLYPTHSKNNDNVWYRDDDSYVFKAGADQTKELAESEYSHTTGSDGRVHIDSEKAGYVHVQATINAFGNKDLQYTLNSYIQWSNIPATDYTEPENFYALSGQDVTLTASVKDVNGNIAQNFDVSWKGINGVSATVNGEKNTTAGKTDSNGECKLTLTSSSAAYLDDVWPSIGDTEIYRLTLTVADKNTVPTKHAAIHWVTPGIHYRSEAGTDDDGYLAGGTPTDVTTSPAEYLVGSTWIIGTKIVGIPANNDPTEIYDISNIKINMSSSSSDNITPEKKDLENGICSLKNTKTGSTTTTARINGFIDEDKDCIITVIKEKEDNDGHIEEDIYQYTCVGKYSLNQSSSSLQSAVLNIPIKWKESGKNLSILNPSGNASEVYSIDSTYSTNTNKVNAYIQVLDDFGNPSVGAEVVYEIKDANDYTITYATAENPATTNDKGLVTIPVTVPRSAAKYTLSANLANETTPTTQTIDFREGSSAFTKSGDPVIDVDARTITVTFTKDLNKNLAELADFYEVKVGTNKVDIDSVKYSTDNTKQIVITTKPGQTLTSSATLSIKSKITDENDNTIRFLLDTTGTLYTGN